MVTVMDSDNLFVGKIVQRRAQGVVIVTNQRGQLRLGRNELIQPRDGAVEQI